MCFPAKRTMNLHRHCDLQKPSREWCREKNNFTQRKRFFVWTLSKRNLMLAVRAQIVFFFLIEILPCDSSSARRPAHRWKWMIHRVARGEIDARTFLALHYGSQMEYVRNICLKAPQRWSSFFSCFHFYLHCIVPCISIFVTNIIKISRHRQFANLIYFVVSTNSWSHRLCKKGEA